MAKKSNRMTNRQLAKENISLPVVGSTAWKEKIKKVEKDLNRPLTNTEYKFMVRLSHVNNADVFKTGKLHGPKWPHSTPAKKCREMRS